MSTHTHTHTHLPNDIITLIITYLPPKPLTRFKLISKHFLSLINHPHFIHLLIQRSTSTLSIASISHSTSPPSLHVTHLPSSQITLLPLPPSLTPKTTPPDLISSCNGLILIAAFPDFLALVNPTTSTFNNIPLPQFTNATRPHSHWAAFGFGFGFYSNEFKIVCVDQVHGTDGVGPRWVRVFSLNDNSWRKVENFPYYLSQPNSHGKCLRGSVHWIASTTDPVVFDLTCLMWNGRLDDFCYDYVLVAFDLETEKFTVLRLPEGCAGGETPRLSVGVSEERLFVQVEFGPRFKRSVDVWVMKEYGVKESWVKVLSFAYMEVRSELMPIMTLALSEGGGGRVLMQQGKDCFWVEGGSGEIKDVVSDGELPFLMEVINGHRCGFGGVVFVESIVCLGSRFGRAWELGGEDHGFVEKKKIKDRNKRYASF